MTSQVREAVASASVLDVVTAASYVAILVALVAELHWLGRRGRQPGRSREAATAAGMFAGALAVGAIYTVAFVALWSRLHALAPAPLIHLWQARPLLGFALAFVAWDAAGFAYHLVGHRTRLGWAAHQPHHSGRRFNLSLGLRQSWAPWHGLLIYPWLALAGWSVGTVVLCLVLSNAWQALEHSAAPVRAPGWLAAAVMTPEAHRHHHALGAEVVNLGPVLTVWDRLAGTWVGGPVPEGTRYGLEGAGGTGVLAVELAGWRALVSGAPGVLARREAVRS